MKPTVYIAGPMRGYPNDNREAFNAAAGRLSAEWQALNPVDFGRILPCEDSDGRNDRQRLDALMAIEREAARRADAIYLLNGWEKSAGARAELLAFLAYHNGNGKILLEGGE